MNKTPDSNAFRAQLVVPEQRQLYDYWQGKAAGRAMPARSDIQPTHIPRILPCISLLDVAADVGRCRVRLAGTRLREIYDREITGLCIQDLDWGDKREYWLASYRHTIEHAAPTQGIVKGPRNHKEHMVQYWLRLPLFVNEASKVAMLLCFDYFLPASEHLEDQRWAAGA